MVYTTAALAALLLPPLALPPLPHTLHKPHTVAAVSLLWVPHFRCHCFSIDCVLRVFVCAVCACVLYVCVCAVCVCGSITATIYSRLHCR